jgi:DNA sulfur modification protein DndD
VKLERITLENFRQYYGTQRLAFAKDPNRRVTVIHGVNGAGKTSLFLALNWCLYGKDAQVNNVGELMNKRTVQEAQAGQTVRTLVELSFLHEAERYVVRRALEGTKRVQGGVDLRSLDEFSMLRIGSDGQAKPVPNPIGKMNAIMPVNVREYFLFDGEKIDNFAKPEASREIKEAIYLVLKLEVLERAARHLDAVAKDYREELKKNSSAELHDLLEQDERAQSNLEGNGRRQAELQEEIKRAKRQIEEIDQRLRESQGAQLLQAQRDGLQRDLERSRSDLTQTVSKIRDLATGAYPAVAQGAIHKALEVLDSARARGEIPSDLRQQFVQDLIERMQCICGRPINDGSPEHARLVTLMERSVSSDLENDVINLTAALRGLGPLMERQRGDLNELSKRRVQLIDEIQGLEAKLDDVSRELKGFPREEIQALERRRADIDADLQRFHIEIGSLGSKAEALSQTRKDLAKKIERARKEENKGKLLSQKLVLAKESADAISDIYRVFANEMRRKIEAKTKEIFHKLVWKEGHFQDVRLDEDFNLEVIDRYGNPMKPELSAGERQVLSLSFITAMSRLSEDEAPIVMDTPFGRLSENHRDSITKHVPELAHQLVLFVTDTELRGEAKANLEPTVGAKYRLDFDTRTGCTDIVEVYA